jgi:hypothetical protein
MGEFGYSGIHGRSGRVAFPRTNVMPVMPARRPEAADAPARRAVQEVRRSEEAMVENVLGELKLYGVLEKERRGEEKCHGSTSLSPKLRESRDRDLALDRTAFSA